MPARAVLTFALALMALPSLLAPSVTLACLTRPLGLQGLIHGADHALVVEIVELERSRLSLVNDAVGALREMTIQTAGGVSDDLALALDELIPDVSRNFYPPVHHAKARVLVSLPPGGPRVGSIIRWTHDPLVHSPIRLGHRAIVFPTPGDSSVLGSPRAPDAVRLLPDSVDLRELLSITEDGFTSKSNDWTNEREWLTAAVRSPEARSLLALDEVIARLDPEIVIDALHQRPSGSPADIEILRRFREYRSPTLDQVALQLTECWLQPEVSRGTRQVMRLAIERWQLPGAQELEAVPHGGIETEGLRRLWQDIRARTDLPVPASPETCQRVAAWNRWLDEVLVELDEA